MPDVVPGDLVRCTSAPYDHEFYEWVPSVGQIYTVREVFRYGQRIADEQGIVFDAIGDALFLQELWNSPWAFPHPYEFYHNPRSFVLIEPAFPIRHFALVDKTNVVFLRGGDK